ncbi:MAG: hypothetical protein HY661_19635 [Betaproteobacteria bacterium]|nr:hypothetical protein [Betaproteobacteria bacterium]
MQAVYEILLRFLMVILWGGSIVGVLLGVALLLKPEHIATLNQSFSRWVSSDKVADQLDRPRWTERFVYRHHRLVGAFFLIGALCILYVFLFGYNARRISSIFAVGYWGVVDVLVGVMLISSALAALVGLIVLTRPSLLREIEKSSNRWISTEGASKALNATYYNSDGYILRRKKIAGVCMIIGSLYVLIVLSPLLWRNKWMIF